MTVRAFLALLVPLAVSASSPSAQETHVLVVKTADAQVISDLSAGFRSAFPGATAEDFLLNDDSAADLPKHLANATAVLSVGPKAAEEVARRKPTAATIACVPPTLADPNRQGPVLRLQPPVDGILATAAWMGSYKRVGFITDGSQKERVELAKVSAATRDMTLVPAPVASAREVVGAVQGLMGKIDLLVIDVTDGLSLQDVQFILKAAQDQQVPVLGTSEGFLKAGAAAAAAIDPRNVGAEAGKLAAARAAGLFDPRRFRVMVNLVATQRLGMTVPQDRGMVDANILTLDTDGSDLVRGAAHGKPVADTRPSVVRQGRLSFPAAALSSGVRAAEVVVEVTVKANGSIADTKVVRGDPLFSSAAVDSLKEWQFKPATKDGAPVDGTIRLNLKFQR